MKRLSTVIITWNERQTLVRCLESFYHSYNFGLDELVVIDNGSEDGTGEVIKKSYPLVRYYRLKKNIGVGPARNRGIMASNGKYIMTLDNDTLFSGECFGDLVDGFFTSHPDCGVLGFNLKNIDGSHQQSCRRFPGWLQPISARLKVSRAIGFFRKIYNDHMMIDVDFCEVSEAMKVDYVIGANQVFRKDLAVEINGYDENIFFGPEDFDFCYRAKASGYQNYYSNLASITHDYQRRTTKFSVITLRHIIGYYYVMLKNKVTHA